MSDVIYRIQAIPQKQYYENAGFKKINNESARGHKSLSRE